jgi:hypothetical protein
MISSHVTSSGNLEIKRIASSFVVLIESLIRYLDGKNITHKSPFVYAFATLESFLALLSIVLSIKRVLPM